MRSLFTFILLLNFLLVTTGCSQDDSQGTQAKKSKGPSYRIGFMICNSEKETLERFLPFTEYLSQKLGANFEPVAIDTVDFTREIDTLHFTHTNSLLYVILKRFHGVDILAAEKKGNLGHLSRGVIVVRDDSEIKTIADLKGKTMIFGPMLAPTGFMSQVDVMQKNGIDPEEDLAFYSIPPGSFKHEKVLYGVFFEKYDAGSLPLDDIDTMDAEGRISRDDFRIIGQAPDIPYCNFGVTQKVDADFAKKFKKVVLSITPEDTVEFNGERVKVLDTALVQGYIDISDADFDVVRDMARRTNMPPYQKY